MQDYSYYGYTTGSMFGAIMGFAVVIWCFCIALCVVMLMSTWKMFSKAGKPGWYQLIPVVNTYQMSELAFGKGWGYLGLVWIVGVLLAGLPAIGWIFTILSTALYFCIAYKFLSAFGASKGMAIAGIILPIVIFPMIAFGNNYKYMGSAGCAPFGIPPVNLSSNDNNNWNQQGQQYQQQNNGWGQQQNNNNNWNQQYQQQGNSNNWNQQSQQYQRYPQGQQGQQQQYQPQNNNWNQQSTGWNQQNTGWNQQGQQQNQQYQGQQQTQQYQGQQQYQTQNNNWNQQGQQQSAGWNQQGRQAQQSQQGQQYRQSQNNGNNDEYYGQWH